MLFTQKSPCDPRISSLLDMNLWSPPRVSIPWRHPVVEVDPHRRSTQVSVTHPRCFKPPSFWGVASDSEQFQKYWPVKREHHGRLSVFVDSKSFQNMFRKAPINRNGVTSPCEQYPKFSDALWKSTGNQIHSSLGCHHFGWFLVHRKTQTSTNLAFPGFLTALRRSLYDGSSVPTLTTVFPKRVNGSFNSKMKVSENDPNRSRWVAHSFLSYSPFWSIFPNSSPWLPRAFFQPLTGLVCCLSPNPGTISFLKPSLSNQIKPPIGALNEKGVDYLKGLNPSC